MLRIEQLVEMSRKEEEEERERELWGLILNEIRGQN